ncbi:hypothetical protein E2C01_039934 [Portunus trituberculatus]|uniref:Uncharacterized protein n=1 Tax=Portunus trituberculatus TaxID=210409 RepID=A0A5B7FG22_PORTR|nr:hypothetical protein [Portunus trituberculatus]
MASVMWLLNNLCIRLNDPRSESFKKKKKKQVQQKGLLRANLDVSSTVNPSPLPSRQAPTTTTTTTIPSISSQTRLQSRRDPHPGLKVQSSRIRHAAVITRGAPPCHDALIAPVGDALIPRHL